MDDGKALIKFLNKRYYWRD